MPFFPNVVPPPEYRGLHTQIYKGDTYWILRKHIHEPEVRARIHWIVTALHGHGQLDATTGQV